MKTNKLVLLCACLMSVLLGAQFAFASGSTGNTTNQQNQASVTSTVAVTAATANAGMIGSRISSMAGAPMGGSGSGGGTGGGLGKGQSSGNGPEGIGVWALGSYNYLDKSKSGASFDGYLLNTMIGADKQIGNFLFGLGFGYEKLDLTTKYNSGNMLYDGWSLVPYMSYSISKDLVADASFSYTWLDYTMKDTQAGTKYSDGMNANRMVTTAGITQYMSFDKLLLSGRLGTLYMNEHQGSYKLNTVDYGQAGIYTWQGSLGLRGAYDMGAFKPFVGATYMQDFVKSGNKSDDMWGADFDLGFNYSPADRWNVGLTGTYGIREEFYKAGGLLNVRYDF